MRFLIIDPAARVTLLEDHPTLDTALLSAGLKPGQVDHGRVANGVSVVVYEYGLFKPVDTANYFTVNGHVCEGPAVLYAFDDAGETVDFPYFANAMNNLIHFRTADEIEREIIGGRLKRPATSVNGKVFWQWPDAPPPDLADRVAAAAVNS